MIDPLHYVRSCLAGATLLLASCANDYTIVLAAASQRSSALEFVIHEKHPSAGAGLPYSYIAVHDVVTSETVWESQRLDHFPTAPSRITYGKSPETFEQHKLAPLQPNKKYSLSIGGPGEMTGRVEFRVDASGTVATD